MPTESKKNGTALFTGVVLSKNNNKQKKTYMETAKKYMKRVSTEELARLIADKVADTSKSISFATWADGFCNLNDAEELVYHCCNWHKAECYGTRIFVFYEGFKGEALFVGAEELENEDVYDMFVQDLREYVLNNEGEEDEDGKVYVWLYCEE